MRLKGLWSGCKGENRGISLDNKTISLCIRLHICKDNIDKMLKGNELFVPQDENLINLYFMSPFSLGKFGH
jgi:hypothetical protein